MAIATDRQQSCRPPQCKSLQQKTRPIRTGHRAPAAYPGAPVQEALPHVLHIDANADDRTTFAQAFADSNVMAELHSLSRASNALLYLNQIGPFVGKPRPRLIFLDLDLPRCDGRTFLEMLKANARFRDIASAILMSTRNHADSQRFRALGVETFLLKPPHQQGYVEIIRSLL